MLFRAIALSLALLVGIGSIIPVIFHDTAEAKPRYKKKKYKKLKKYSKAWWRWYHKQQRKKRAVLARKRALRAKQILLARQRAQQPKQVAFVKVVKPSEKIQTPKAVKETQPVQNETQFPINDDKGKSVGTVMLSVVGQAIGADAYKKIGGVSTSSLRRGVVDKMVKEDGWVINDYHKLVNGKNVYVVLAQSSNKGVIQSRVFYFTEVDGKIYSVSASCSNDAQERIARESEKMIQSLQRGSNVVGLK